MRKLLVFLLLFFGADLFAKKMIRVGEDYYYLVSEEVDALKGSTREFVKPTESMLGWTTLIRVQELYREKSAKKYVDELARQYKLAHPTLQFEIFNKEGTDEWGIDYLLFLVLPHNQRQAVLWDYFYVKNNPTNKGIIVDHFIGRKSLEDFLNGSGTEGAEARKTYRQEMISLLRANEFVIEESIADKKSIVE
jgi:hypothetical protein